MPYYTEGTLTTDTREIAVSETWDSQSDWEAYQSASQVEITSGVVQLASIPDSGVSRWRFEQDATDSWGTNDGNVNGASFDSDSAVNEYAASFDGSDDSIDVPWDSSLANGQFSFGAWVKAPSQSDNDVICMESTGPWLKISTNGGTALVTTTIDSNTSDTSGSATAFDDSYHHVFVTFNGSDVVLYVDGSEDLTESKSGSQEYTSEDMSIGRRAPDGRGGNELNGLVDDVRVYSRALSSTEVDNLYNTGSIDG